MSMAEKQDRVLKANRLLLGIASCGRKFFRHNDRVSQLELDHRWRVWFIDSWSGKRVYTHYKYDWRGFSEGGTLRKLIAHLRDYIRTGQPIPSHQLGPWPEWLCGGDLWAYGPAMAEVRELATNLGIIKPQQEPNT